VAPVLLPEDSQLAKVTGALNAVHYEAEPVNILSAIGPGAGAGPTASAVLADILDIASHRHAAPFGLAVSQLSAPAGNAGADDATAYYIRMMVTDKPGVLASVTEILKDESISIESLIQKGRHDQDPVALVMVTHEVAPSKVAAACERLSQLESVDEVSVSLPVLV